MLHLDHTRVTDAGCATLAAALNSGVLPALKMISLDTIPARATAKKAVQSALANRQ